VAAPDCAEVIIRRLMPCSTPVPSAGWASLAIQVGKKDEPSNGRRLRDRRIELLVRPAKHLAHLLRRHGHVIVQPSGSQRSVLSQNAATSPCGSITGSGP